MSKIRNRAVVRRLAAADWAVIALDAEWLARRRTRRSSPAPAPKHGAGAPKLRVATESGRC